MKTLQRLSDGSRYPACSMTGKRRKRLLRHESLETRRLLAVFVVTTEADLTSPSDGVLSLREAVVSANTSPGTDRIEFDSSLDGVPIGIGTSVEGDFDITDNVSIAGSGIHATILDGNQVDRVFHVHSGVRAVLRDLTIRNGFATSDSGLVDSVDTLGGGVLIEDAELLMERVRMTFNQAFGGFELTVPDPSQPNQFIEIAGAGKGGAIYLLGSGKLTIRDSEITNNIAAGRVGQDRGHQGEKFVLPNEGGDAYGGGIASGFHPNIGTTGQPTIVIERSKITDNTSRSGKGGATTSGTFNDQRTGQDSRDSGDAFGGGLFLEDAIATIRQSHVQGNNASGSDGPIGGRGNRRSPGVPAGRGGDGGAARGGGFVAVHSILKLVNTAVLSNEAHSGDGGRGGAGDGTSPVSQNGADGGNGGGSEGGGIYLIDTQAEFRNSTLRDNVAKGGEPGKGGVRSFMVAHSQHGAKGLSGIPTGGGIFTTQTDLDAFATLISENVATQNPDASATFGLTRSVLMTNSSGASGIVHGTHGNLLDVDTRLALNNATIGTPVDIDGNARPQGGGFDIGATEQRFGSVFVVNTTDDTVDANLSDGIALDTSGNVSLRAAIEQANANSDPEGLLDLILFDIPGNEPHQISVTSALPAITDPLIMDGTSQEGYAGIAGAGDLSKTPPVIQIDGGESIDIGLTVLADNSTVSGLSLTGFTQYAIEIDAYESAVLNSYVGIDPAGNQQSNQAGIVVNGRRNVIRHNVISGNQLAGVRIRLDAHHTNVSNNYIGTTPRGTTAIGNGTDGVTVLGRVSTVDSNVISGNMRAGVFVTGSHLAGNSVISRNKIGTDVFGATAIANQTGVLVRSTGTHIAENLISGNSDSGIWIVGADASRNTVRDNNIGLDGSGTVALPNGVFGVHIQGADTNVIRSNRISGNSSHGLVIDQFATQNSVIDNKIGTDASGSSAIANRGDGIRMVRGAHRNTIWQNQISGNQLRGVALDGPQVKHNFVGGNLIGTDADGTAPLHNESVDAVRVLAPHSRITSNVISAPVIGIMVGAGANGFSFRENYIGTDQYQSDSGLGMRIGVKVFSGIATGWIVENVIGFNNKAVVVENGAWGVQILQNSMFQNFIGIDLGNDGPTPNDTHDGDQGANRLQNSPAIFRSKSSGNRIQIGYSVDSTVTAAAYPLAVQFFLNIGSEPGQGRRFIGQATYETAQASQEAIVTFTGVSVPVGGKVIATATDANGNTSEFGNTFIAEEYVPPALIADTNGDGVVTAMDALLVINYLAKQDTKAETLFGENNPSTIDTQLDTNGDGTIPALDALIVLNRLGKMTTQSSAIRTQPLSLADDPGKDESVLAVIDQSIATWDSSTNNIASGRVE